MLAELKGDGAALLLTTHQLEEAEARCDRVVIIDHGREVAAGTVAKLVERCFGASSTVSVTARHEIADPPAPFAVEPGSRVLRAKVADLAGELTGLLATITASGIEIENLEVRRPGLGQVFLALTGRELRE
jgi:ABC-2 type transport system ATP-binding protein